MKLINLPRKGVAIEVKVGSPRSRIKTGEQKNSIPSYKDLLDGAPLDARGGKNTMGVPQKEKFRTVSENSRKQHKGGGRER